jgi:signal transduction histidine kinase
MQHAVSSDFSTLNEVVQQIDNQPIVSVSDVRILLRKSRQAEQTNDLVTALVEAQAAWKTFHQLDHQPQDVLADLLYQIAHIHLRRQDFAQLEAYCRPALELARQTHDEHREAWALLNLGIVRSIESDYEAAMIYFLESFQKSEKTSFRENAAFCLINIGNLYGSLFNYEDAFDRYQRALTDYADALNDTTRIATFINIGNMCHAAEQFELALEYFEKSLRLATEKKQTHRVAHAHVLVSRTLLAQNELRIAEEHSREVGENVMAVRQIHLMNLAEIAFLHHNTEGGIALATQGIAAARRIKDDASELRGFRLLANIFEQLNDYQKAFRAQKMYAEKQAEFLRTQRSMHAIDVEIRYSLREKQRKIDELTRENHYQARLLEQNDQIAQQNELLKTANEELQQFAYITSHDLKEPLRMIGSYSQLVRKQYLEKLGEDPHSTLYFKYINEGVTRMNGLLDALLQYATIGKTEVELELVNLEEVVRVVKQNLEIAIQERQATVVATSLPRILSVQSLLHQLFQNLIGNALKFCPSERAPYVRIAAEEHDDHWLFSISDNGIGIAEEHLQRVFIIFQRLHKRNKYAGTGIGLAICQKIVSQLGGKIWAESALDKGTVFYFILPK